METEKLTEIKCEKQVKQNLLPTKLPTEKC